MVPRSVLVGEGGGGFVFLPSLCLPADTLDNSIGRPVPKKAGEVQRSHPASEERPQMWMCEPFPGPAGPQEAAALEGGQALGSRFLLPVGIFL